MHNLKCSLFTFKTIIEHKEKISFKSFENLKWNFIVITFQQQQKHKETILPSLYKDNFFTKDIHCNVIAWRQIKVNSIQY